MFDFFFGAIVGVFVYSIVLKIKEQKEKQNKPRRGRPPKNEGEK